MGPNGQNGKGTNVAQFQAPPGTPILGQPVTIVTLECIRLDGVIHCNCQPSNPDLTVTDGKATCEACGKQYALLFNPTNSRLELRVGVPEKPEVPA
jgi:hypothetical protein